MTVEQINALKDLFHELAPWATVVAAITAAWQSRRANVQSKINEHVTHSVARAVEENTQITLNTAGVVSETAQKVDTAASKMIDTAQKVEDIHEAANEQSRKAP